MHVISICKLSFDVIIIETSIIYYLFDIKIEQFKGICLPRLHCTKLDAEMAGNNVR